MNTIRNITNSLLVVKNAMLIGLLFAITSTFAQDIHFSNFNQNPLFLNPGMTGVFEGNHRASINYRDQWRSVTTPFTTATVAYDGKFMKGSGGWFGLGLSMFTDRIGDSKLTTNQVNLNVSYVKNISSDNELSVGFQGGYANKSIDLTTATWGEQFNGSTFDSSLPSGETISRNSVGYVDLGAGLNFGHYGDYLTLNQGIAAYHVNPARIEYLELNEDALKMRINIHGGFKYSIKNSNLSLNPSYMYSRKSNINLFVGGMCFEFQLKEGSKYTGNIQAASYNIGVYYRNNDAVIFSLGYKYSRHEVKVAYDTNISHLSGYSNSFGGVELSYIFHTPNTKRSGAALL